MKKISKVLTVLVLCVSFLCLPGRSYAWFHCPVVSKGGFVPTLPGSQALHGAGLIGSGFAGLILFLTVPHIPDWTAAKHNGTEKAYQSQQMFPQQFFSRLPGGDNYKK